MTKVDDRPLDEKPRQVNKRIILVGGILILFFIFFAIKKSLKGYDLDQQKLRVAAEASNIPQSIDYNIGSKSFEKAVYETAQKHARKDIVTKATVNTEAEIRELEQQSEPQYMLSQEELDHIRMIKDALWAPMQIKTANAPTTSVVSASAPTLLQRLDPLQKTKNDQNVRLDALRKQLSVLQANSEALKEDQQ